jgi:hypothetical protein
VNGESLDSGGSNGAVDVYAAATSDSVILYIPATRAGDSIALVRGVEAPAVCVYDPVSGGATAAEVEVTEDEIILPGPEGVAGDRVFAAGTLAELLLSV